MLLQREQDRYGLEVPEDDEHGDAGGSEGASGHDSSSSAQPDARPKGDGAEASALAQAVKDIAAAHRNLFRARAQERARQEHPGQEAAGGVSGQDEGEPVAPAEAAFLKLLTDVTREPEGHPLAPIVFALIKGTDDVVDVESLTDEGIWSTAFVYLRDALLRIDGVVPADADYPFEALAERLQVPLKALSLAPARQGLDTPELRAALWASERMTAHGYEPFDDEAVLVALVKNAAAELGAPAASASPLPGLLRYRVLVELIAARDPRDEIVRQRPQPEHELLATVGRVAGALGLLGLVFPPAAAASKVIGLAALLGDAIVAIRDVETANDVTDVRAIGALLNSDEAAYATALVGRPSVASVLLKLIVEAALFHALFHSVSRKTATRLQVIFDLIAIAPSGAEVQDWLGEE